MVVEVVDFRVQLQVWTKLNNIDYLRKHLVREKRAPGVSGGEISLVEDYFPCFRTSFGKNCLTCFTFILKKLRWTMEESVLT